MRRVSRRRSNRCGRNTTGSIVSIPAPRCSSSAKMRLCTNSIPRSGSHLCRKFPRRLSYLQIWRAIDDRCRQWRIDDQCRLAHRANDEWRRLECLFVVESLGDGLDPRDGGRPGEIRNSRKQYRAGPFCPRRCDHDPVERPKLKQCIRSGRWGFPRIWRGSRSSWHRTIRNSRPGRSSLSMAGSRFGSGVVGSRRCLQPGLDHAHPICLPLRFTQNWQSEAGWWKRESETLPLPSPRC